MSPKLEIARDIRPRFSATEAEGDDGNEADERKKERKKRAGNFVRIFGEIYENAPALKVSLLNVS
mgnify:CR=1 FL=1